MKDEVEIDFRDTFEDGVGVRSARQFLQNTIEYFVEESFKFHKHWGEFPFIYSEKQVNSVITPAIYKCTENIWLEQPFKKTGNNQRFLDIATTKGKNIYLIELKHSWNSKIDGVAKYTDKEWEKAIEQISDINRRTIGAHFNYKEYTVFKIALMVMPTYLSSETQHSILNLSAKEYTDMLFEEYERYTAKKNKANFIGSIKIKEPMKYEHEYFNGNQIYPFISFVARIEKI